jgi:hypothetical protein
MNAKMSLKCQKKSKILNQELYQKGKISALRHAQKRSIQGHDIGAYNNWALGLTK